MSFVQKGGVAIFFVLLIGFSGINVNAESKRELYEIHCGIAKETVTSKMKKLSRREILAHCSGSSAQTGGAQTATQGTVGVQAVHGSLSSRSDNSGTSRRLRISGGSMAHVGIQDGSIVKITARTPRVGDHIAFAGSKCGGSSCLKTLASVNAQGCIWVKGRPGRWGNGNYSIDSSQYGWICNYRILGVIS